MNLYLLNQVFYPFFCLVVLTSILGYGNIIKKYKYINDKFYNLKNLIFIQGLIFVSFFTIIFNYFTPITNIITLLIVLIGSLIYLVCFFNLKKKKKEIIFILFTVILSFVFSFYSGVSDDFAYHYETIQNFKNNNIFEISHHRTVSYNSHWLFLISVFSINDLTSTIFVLTSLIYSILIYDLYSLYLKSFKNKNYYIGLSSFFILIFFLSVLNKYKDFGTDIPGTIILFYVLLIFVYFLLEQKNKNANNLLFFIIPLISIAFIIKITNSLIIIFFLLLGLKLNFKLINYKYLFIPLSLSLLLPLLWFFQNLNISGCLIWPIEFTCYKNNELALVEYYLIESFAKGDISTNMNVDGYIWILTWLENHSKKLVETYLVFTLIILLPASYYLLKNREKHKESINFYIKYFKNPNYLALISIVFTSNLLWFFYAPAYRFGIFYNLSLIIFLVLPFWLKLIQSNYKLTLKFCRIISLIAFIYFLIINVNKYNWYFKRYDVWPPIEENKLIPRKEF